MKKNKVILSFAVASALWMSAQMPEKTEAASTNPAVQEKVYVYHSQNVNINEFNRFIEETLQRLGLQDYFKLTVSAKPENTPAKQNAAAPKAPENAPAEKAPEKAPAPKKAEPAPAKVQQPAKPAAPAKAPAPVKPQPAPAKKPTAEQPASTLSAYEQQVVSLTNQERAKAGLPALKIDTALSKMAREKSRDMSANGYFDHNSPTYGSPFDMMKKFGITYSYAGENIAMGQRTPQEVVTAWMNSEGHRQNILNPNFTHIGVGHIAQGNYWTQEFIGK
ncbi:sporulation protein [Neobacillus notoginsengisoli]|uniref:Sporulation protein n=1 Tax=Neobacillus notoginsengisoli TaxID=1578198 RepID=A0A417YWM2_9BACI|nr:CAP domain-containing protein [Neobacillus notoginsengisoli]RHW41651.1 sporulation protein [Neobacillus notoginsengisoli]